jgi:hypothetical protein
VRPISARLLSPGFLAGLVTSLLLALSVGFSLDSGEATRVAPRAVFNYDAADATSTAAGIFTAAPTTTSPSPRSAAFRAYDTAPQHARLNIAAIPARLAAEGVAGGLRFTEDQNALIQLAKNAKRRGGLTEEEGKILKEWGDEYNVPVRGPESHPGRGFGSNPHYHVGPVQHIPVR